MGHTWMRRQLAALVVALAAVLALGTAPVVGVAEEPQDAPAVESVDAAHPDEPTGESGDSQGEGDQGQGQPEGQQPGDNGSSGDSGSPNTPANGSDEGGASNPGSGSDDGTGAATGGNGTDGTGTGADAGDSGTGTGADAGDSGGTDAPQDPVTEPEVESEPEPEPEPEAAPSVSYRAWVGSGWQAVRADGAQVGTTGRMLEGLRISVLDGKGKKTSGSITYRAHVQGTGWMAWASDGATIGRPGAGKRVEAIQIKLTGTMARQYDVYYRVYAAGYGWMGWAKNGAPAGSTGQSKRIEAVEVVLVEKGGSAPSSTGVQHKGAFVDGTTVSVTAHVQRHGWMSAVTGGKTAGTTGEGLRVEALRISVQNAYVSGSIVYQAHVQGVGWQGSRRDGALAGTTGKAKRVEALRIRLTGQLAENYDVYYRVHVQSFGWLGWAKNGQDAGTTGMSKRVESVQIRIVPKGAAAPSNSGCVTTLPSLNMGDAGVSYAAKVAGDSGFQSTKRNGSTAGTTGQGKAVTAFQATVSNKQGTPSGGITYQVHVAGGSWQGWRSNGAEASAGSRGMDCIRIKLTGDLATFYDVYYRVHVSKLGWLEWTKNGEKAGTLDYGFQIQAIQVKLVPRNGKAPGPATYSYFDRKSGQLYIYANARQRRVVSTAYGTPSPGRGLCAAWVSTVISVAGFGYYGGNANDLYDQWLRLTDVRQLRVGMCVGVSRHSHTRLGRIYGHIGIYIGNGRVMDNVGDIRIVPLSWWIAHYGDLVPVHYGWLGNKKLA